MATKDATAIPMDSVCLAVARFEGQETQRTISTTLKRSKLSGETHVSFEKNSKIIPVQTLNSHFPVGICFEAQGIRSFPSKILASHFCRVYKLVLTSPGAIRRPKRGSLCQAAETEKDQGDEGDGPNVIKCQSNGIHCSSTQS